MVRLVSHNWQVGVSLLSLREAAERNKKKEEEEEEEVVVLLVEEEERTAISVFSFLSFTSGTIVCDLFHAVGFNVTSFKLNRSFMMITAIVDHLFSRISPTILRNVTTVSSQDDFIGNSLTIFHRFVSKS